MMKVNDFLKYDIKLKIDYDDYFRLIYDTKYLIEARLGPNRTFIATKSVYGNNRRKAVKQAVEWFWKDFKGVLGSAHKVMTVNALMMKWFTMRILHVTTSGIST